MGTAKFPEQINERIDDGLRQDDHAVDPAIAKLRAKPVDRTIGPEEHNVRRTTSGRKPASSDISIKLTLKRQLKAVYDKIDRLTASDPMLRPEGELTASEQVSLLRRLLLLLVAASLCSPAIARVTTTAKVRYETSAGRSKWYSVDVHLFTGSELGQATRQWTRFSSFKKYAVIFWGDNQATVIEISTLLFCGTEFSQSCMPMLGKIEGKDQDGDKWEVCTAMFCGCPLTFWLAG